METKFDKAYIEISVPIFKRFSGSIPFDIYVKRTEDDYTKIFKSKDALDWERINQYLNKGVRSFYVTKAEYRTYLTLIEQMSSKFFGGIERLPNDEATTLLKEMVSLCGFELIVKTNIHEETINQAAEMVAGCITKLNDDPGALVKIIKMITDNGYHVKHATSVAIFAIIIAKAAHFESKNNLQTIGLGAFLHDIGVTQLPFDPEDKDSFSAEEWREVRKHPELGKRMLDAIPSISMEIKKIVLEHHEQPNGNGYPNGLRANAIYMPAKIVSIADSFSALISDRPFRAATGPAQAIAIMKEDMGKFDKKLLEAFAEQIAPTR